jgi:hypothetical protein
MKIKSFSPTTDWYFVFCGVKDEIVNYRLAGFATVEGEGGESDQIVGMVPVTGGGQNSIMPGVCHLSTVPPVNGTYKHFSELDAK